MQIEYNNDETLLVSKSKLESLFTRWDNDRRAGKTARGDPAKTAEAVGREQADYAFNELSKVCAK